MKIPALALFMLYTLFSGSDLSAQRLPENITELTKELSIQMEKQHVAGMMMTIVTRDSVLFTGGLGLADIESQESVTKNHLFRQASVTKIFVALGITQLVKERKLSVNTKLREIAPEIPFENKWEKTHPVTIGDLMEHTTAFSDKSPFEEYNFSGKKKNPLEALKVFRKFMVSRWKPGERHSYSNVNYAILAYVIEKVSGVSSDEYLKKKVFIPLGMSNANLLLTPGKTGLYSKGYVWKNNRFRLVPHQPPFNAGYSALNASAGDYSLALKYFLTGETPNGQFLSKDMLNDTETPHHYLSAKAGLKNTYAYGNECFNINGHIFRGHNGAIGGYLSRFVYSRETGVAYAFSLNTHNESFFHYADQLISHFLLRNKRKHETTAEIPVKKAIAERYRGYYRLSNPSQLYSGFFESLTNTFHIGPAGNALKVDMILRGSMNWKAADHSGLRYSNKNAATSQIVFLKDEDNKLSIADGTLYFSKITAAEAWLPLIFLIFSFIVLISTHFFGGICLLTFLLRKNRLSELPLRLAPAFATSGLLIILITIPDLFEHMREASDMFYSRLLWHSGKYIFVIFSVVFLYLLLIKWKHLGSRVLKIYLGSVCISCCYVLALLIANHFYP
ncbi:beta-lactamase family protein [Nostoc sp. CHAB 5824]|nr:beta-lactamase family protein [Nostoc sp. CHAB 5824]